MPTTSKNTFNDEFVTRESFNNIIKGSVVGMLWSELEQLIDSVVTTDINNAPNFNDRMYAYMARFMGMNYYERLVTLSAIGQDAYKLGDPDSQPDQAIDPWYARENNYYKFIEDAKMEEKVGHLTTRVDIHPSNKSTDSEYGDYQNLGSLYKKSINLYPDEKDQFKSTTFNDIWETDDNINSLLYKTKKLFAQKKINTIISSFGTGADNDSDKVSYNGKNATSYGESHGKNLLKKSAEDSPNSKYLINGYNNPYCRVFTHHYQYDKYSKLIRPFTEENLNGEDKVITNKQLHKWNNFALSNTDTNSYGWKDTNSRWDDSVLDKKTGILNIAPKYGGGGNKNIHTKQCMFSIENLAWKDYNPYSFETALSWEQRGPMGGRIMWFPPYGITFNETTSAKWNSNDFIGRGEPVYTYTNTERSGNLTFLMLVDHPSIIDYVSWFKSNETNVKDTDYLRYFAGCDYGTLNDNAQPTPLTDEYVRKNISPSTTKVSPNPTYTPGANTIEFIVYFPNNYSGTYDIDEGDVNPIAYLICGTNAQKEQVLSEDNVYEEGRNKILDFENEFDSNGLGYEIGTVPVTKSDANENFIIGAGINEGENKTHFWDGIQKSNDGTYQYPYSSVKKWYYRIDGTYDITDETINPDKEEFNRNTYCQTLKGDQYKDTQSFQLNSVINTTDSTFTEFKKNIGIENDERFYSLSEIVYALYKDDTTHSKVITYLKGKNIKFDEERMSNLKALLDRCKNSNNIKSFTIYGISSSDGKKYKYGEKRNEILANGRYNAIKEWLSENKIDTTNVSKGNSIYASRGNVKTDPNDKEMKMYRSAYVKIVLNDDGENGNSQFKGFNKTGETQDGQEIYTKVGGDNTKWYYDSEKKEMVQYNLQTENRYKNSDTTNNDGITYQGGGDNDADVSEKNNIRYDQEYYFYKKLESVDPVIFTKLKDKIQYFDPAFHSMTPEGFNGRLTFLQQCMRQGDTITMSDLKKGTYGQTANNLAFGRPPFCVLRLGDFYNQLIVIDSISISYDFSGGVSWDLNDEGIGVQPLLAQVNLGFKFVGGGDIAGPVRRLQNAMSFNYYANASLYDNRADRMSYTQNELTMGGAGNNEIDENNTYYHSVEKYDEYNGENNK